MIKILFVCHGNICRSPMAEFVMKDLVKKAGLEQEYEIASAAVSSEELGNPVYPPAKRMLAAHGIDCSGKRARRINAGDYKYYDYIIGMDSSNMRWMDRILGGDPEHKLYKLLDLAGRNGADVADPWYTGDFQETWDDVLLGCQALLKITQANTATLDLSACRSKSEMYARLADVLPWKDWYGENLDALWDVLTREQIHREQIRFLMPDETALKNYAIKIAEAFREAGWQIEEA